MTAPQFAGCEQDGEECGRADHDQCPDEEEGSVRVGDPAAGNSRSRHVDHWDARRKKRQDQNQDVPRTPFGEQQRCSVQPDDHKDYGNEV